MAFVNENISPEDVVKYGIVLARSAADGTGARRLPTPLHATQSQAMPSAHELAFLSASTRWNDHLSLRRMAS
jgi:hypothetical protein